MTSGDRTWQSWPLGTLFATVAPGRATLRAMATDAENLDLVRRFWDTLYAKDFDGLKAFFDERSQYWDVPTGPEAAAVGPDDIDGRLRLGLEPLAGYHHEISAMVAADDIVVTEHAETWEWHTGETVTLPFVSVQRIRDGVIGRWTDYWNMPTLMDAAPEWWHERLFTSDLAWLTDLSGEV